MIEVVAALMVDPDGRVLMVRKRGTEVFMNPGGKPEPGEDAIRALRRELVEEIGLDFEPSAFEPLGVFLTDAANEPGEQLRAECFRIAVSDPTHQIAAEIVESRWIDPAAPGDTPLAPLALDHLLPLIHPPADESLIPGEESLVPGEESLVPGDESRNSQ